MPNRHVNDVPNDKVDAGPGSQFTLEKVEQQVCMARTLTLTLTLVDLNRYLNPDCSRFTMTMTMTMTAAV